MYVLMCICKLCIRVYMCVRMCISRARVGVCVLWICKFRFMLLDVCVHERGYVCICVWINQLYLFSDSHLIKSYPPIP